MLKTSALESFYCGQPGWAAQLMFYLERLCPKTPLLPFYVPFWTKKGTPFLNLPLKMVHVQSCQNEPATGAITGYFKVFAICKLLERSEKNG